MSSKHDRRLSAILNKAVQTQNAKLLVRGLKYEMQFSWSDFDARQQIKEPPVTEESLLRAPHPVQRYDVAVHRNEHLSNASIASMLVQWW